MAASTTVRSSIYRPPSGQDIKRTCYDVWAIHNILVTTENGYHFSRRVSSAELRPVMDADVLLSITKINSADRAYVLQKFI
jgi:hypothetical protein